MAAVDITVAQAELVGQIAAVVSVGVAVLLVYLALSAFRNIRQLLGGSGSDPDYWDGYSADDDARDRKAAAMEAVYARASAMASAGEGQSEDFRHNMVTAAYDAGYTGKYLGDSLDPAASAAWNQARADRAADNADRVAREEFDAAYDEYEDRLAGER